MNHTIRPIHYKTQDLQHYHRFLRDNLRLRTLDPAYVAAKGFMDSKGVQSVTDALNNEFAGIVAEKYYKAVKEAVMKVISGEEIGTLVHN